MPLCCYSGTVSSARFITFATMPETVRNVAPTPAASGTPIDWRRIGRAAVNPSIPWNTVLSDFLVDCFTHLSFRSFILSTFFLTTFFATFLATFLATAFFLSYAIWIDPP